MKRTISRRIALIALACLAPLAAPADTATSPKVHHYIVAWRARSGGAPFTGTMDLKFSQDGIVSGTYRADSVRPDPMNGKFVPVTGGRDGEHIHFTFLGMGPGMTFSGTIDRGHIVASSRVRGRVYDFEGKPLHGQV